jgi:hypothetical protein
MVEGTAGQQKHKPLHAIHCPTSIQTGDSSRASWMKYHKGSMKSNASSMVRLVQAKGRQRRHTATAATCAEPARGCAGDSVDTRHLNSRLALQLQLQNKLAV